MREAGADTKKKLVLVELNEINCDVVGKYVERQHLPAFARLLSGNKVRTVSEVNYEQLEPWIQWPSVHTGLSASEHGIFRLGDIISCKKPQIFELLEAQGLRVGCVSAMNAENRLNKPAYFLPDPWTQTSSDPSWWSRALSSAISQAVNDNAQSRVTASSAVRLLLGFIRFARPSRYPLYLKLALSGRKASWRRALFLDLLVHDVHWHLFQSRNPNFSTVFFNAGAHIQHHYFFNAKVLEDLSIRNPSWYSSAEYDPIAEMLHVYDLILQDYLSAKNVDVIVATGLSQKPYDRLKLYYRLKNHREFLALLGVPFKDVAPRMTRDFLVECTDATQAAAAEALLKQVMVGTEKTPLFGEIDNRGTSLFVTLTYPNEISERTMFASKGVTENLAPHVVFVAVKNGMHQSEGFAFFSSGVAGLAPANLEHVKNLYNTIWRYFGLEPAQPMRLVDKHRATEPIH